MAKDSKRIIALLLTLTTPIWLIPALIVLVFMIVYDIMYWIMGVDE